MYRNYSASPFLRIPLELRIRVYRLVFGGHRIGITHTGSKLEQRGPNPWKSCNTARAEQPRQWFHTGGRFEIFIPQVLHLGLSHICRQIYTETSLLLYSLNTFTFKDDSVKKMFEQKALPGKKRAQKKAVGKYDVGGWREFDVESEQLKLSSRLTLPTARRHVTHSKCCGSSY